MPTVASGWQLRVDRGPDWLFVRVSGPPKGEWPEPPLADEVWSLLEQHFVYRLALELDNVPLLHSFLLGQLVLLQKRIREHHGMLRICGLSRMNEQVLNTHGLTGRFASYNDREDALMGVRPARPR